LILTRYKMARLNIIRASAGSGKTHFLTGFFLKTIITEHAGYFKEILAVTFTNKATAEMKRRILWELSQLASGKPSNYLSLLIQTTAYKEPRIREKCALLLKTILHNYSWFSVETIDSFFQRVIRGFTHEIGIPGNYLVEIELQPVLEYAVDRLLDTLHDNNECLEWLIQYAEDRIQLGKAWDMRQSLVRLGFEVFKERFSEKAPELIAAVSDREGMHAFRNELMLVKSRFENRLKKIGTAALTYISEGGFLDEDFYQKSNGPAKIFRKLQVAEMKNSAGEFYTRTNTARKLFEHADNWPSGTTRRRQDVITLAEQKLLPLLKESIDFIEQNYRKYYTALEIMKNLYSVGILADLAEKIREYRVERNAFILSDAPVLINSIIDQNDSPFLFEKMGNRYGHFLIDEFQDTSALQWHNFKPLISNALSQGKDNLVVGDAKQSIYRWRNSNWEILASKIGMEYPTENLHVESLKTNWRSGEQIVRFISQLFPILSGRLKTLLQDILGDMPASAGNLQSLENIYSDVIQDAPKFRQGRGDVYMRFFTSEEVGESDDYFHELLISKINDLLKNGFAANDIVILVRDGKEGKSMANLLIEFNAANRFETDLNILSEESLVLTVSNAVNVLISAMQFLLTPQDKLVNARLMAAFEIFKRNSWSAEITKELAFDGESFSEANLSNVLPAEFLENIPMLNSMPLFDLAERLIGYFEMQHSLRDIPYIHTFLDTLHEFTQTNTANLAKFLEYWEEKGSLKTIPATQSQNAVRILTIHKAKGLEFRAVILPFCSWKLDQMTNTTHWAGTAGLTFNYLPIVPLNYQKGLKDTEFAPEYYDEKFRSYVDNLNLLYVALTRAIDSLIIFPVFSISESNTRNISTVGDLLFEAITDGGEKSLLDHFNASTLLFEIRSQSLNLTSDKEQSGNEQIFQGDNGVPALNRFSFSSKGAGYFKNIHSTSLHGRQRGSVLHSILATIVVHSDLNRIVRQAVLDGLITGPESQQLKDHILACFSNELVFSWFNGSGLIYTEKEILLQNNDTRRPDRVVIFPEKVHVIDYKFGEERFVEKHRIQVLDYARILESMNYTTIEGYIWYIDQNKVITA
jgi:ATP-dependent helicase/nuclease subunit A